MPASNPGSDNPSGGIAKGNGGVSASAYVMSPVPSEQQSVTGAVMEKVSSALSYLGLGGGEKTSEQREEESQQNESQTSSSRITTKAAEAGAAATATAAATAAAVTGSDSTFSDTAEGRKESDNKTTTGVETTDCALSTSEIGSIDKNMADTSPKDEGKTESTNETTENTGGSEESEQKKRPGHAGKENRDAIPTAGGERLGDKHWGESKIVPDVPKASESENISSADGQPTRKSLAVSRVFVYSTNVCTEETKDNTAKNTGGASGGPGSGAVEGEGKQKLTDKIKDKLPFGKKD